MKDYLALSKATYAYKEDNCCSVVSLAAAFELSFKESLDICQMSGRKRRQGMSPSNFYSAAKTASGLTGRTISCKVLEKRMTLKKFLKNNPEGTFILFMHRHVATAKDGTLIDWTEDSPKMRNILAAYKVWSDK